MSPRLKKYTYLFALSFCCMAAMLWAPLSHHLHQKSVYRQLTSVLKRKESLYQDRKAAEKFYGTINERLTRMTQTGFMGPIDQRAITKQLTDLAGKNRVSLKQFYFGDSLSDRPNGLFTITYLPVKTQLTAKSEESTYETIRSFNATVPGMILPIHLKLTQIKKNDFLVAYDFYLIRGTWAKEPENPQPKSHGKSVPEGTAD